MEAGDCAARDGNEQEREQLATDDRATAVNELSEGRELNVGMNDKDPDDQKGYGSQLHVSRQIVSRFKQKPYRQDRGDETIGHHEEDDLMSAEG